MKKFIFLLICIVFAEIGCKNNKPVKTTLLEDYTPYGQYPERIIGKVEKVVEKNYWGVAEGESFIKGNPLTVKARDTISWTNDFEAAFDNSGDLVSCSTMDENGKTISKWVLAKSNGILTSAEYTFNDSLRFYQKLKCNETGDIIEEVQFRPLVDTLIETWKIIRDSTNVMIEYQKIDYKGNLSRRYPVKYDMESRFTGLETYNEIGELLSFNRITYNDKGIMAELIFYDKDKKVSNANYFTYEYDQRGNWIKAIVKDDKGNVVIEERKYTYFE